jgi:hypothetical protein
MEIIMEVDINVKIILQIILWALFSSLPFLEL